MTAFRLCRPSVQTVAKVAMNMFNSAVDFIQFDKIDRIEFDFVASVYRALVWIDNLNNLIRNVILWWFITTELNVFNCHM